MQALWVGPVGWLIAVLGMACSRPVSALLCPLRLDHTGTICCTVCTTSVSPKARDPRVLQCQPTQSHTLRSSKIMSCISAATSTPVGPPPHTTKDSSLLRSSSGVCTRDDVHNYPCEMCLAWLGKKISGAESPSRYFRACSIHPRLLHVRRCCHLAWQLNWQPNVKVSVSMQHGPERGRSQVSEQCFLLLS